MTTTLPNSIANKQPQKRGIQIMKVSGLRWWVVGLVALATIINYIDRQTLSVALAYRDSARPFPNMDADGHKEIYATISIVFVFSYAFGQAIFGKIFDWVGTRLGFVYRSVFGR